MSAKKFSETTIWKTGDSFSHTTSRPKKGAELYADEYTKELEKDLDQLDMNEEKKKQALTAADYKTAETLQDIETLGMMESKFSKSAFRILLVDDDADVRFTNFEIIKEEGFLSITIANNAVEAVQLLQSNKYDLILSDYRMGGGRYDGNKIFDYLFEYVQPNERPTFIIISGFSDFESVALKEASIIMLPKPMTYTKLLTIVKGVYVKFLRQEMKKLA